LRAEARLPGAGHLHYLIEVIGCDARYVVVALQKLVPVGDLLLLETEDDLVDERNRLSGILEQAGCSVCGLSLAWIRFPEEVGIALQHHLTIRVVDRHHVRSRADRIPVQRKIALRHSRLRKET